MTSPSAQLKEITSQATPPLCVVITSTDRVRRERALNYLLEHFTSKKKLKSSFFSFTESGRANLTGFIRDLEEPSLFEPNRFGVIRSIELARAADVEPLSAFLKKEVLGSHLIIIGASLPNTPNFKKTLEAHATQVAFEPLKGAELSRWVEREVKHQGLSAVPDEVTALLIALGSDDADSIAQLIEKFSLYLGDAAPTKSALQALEPGRATASDFDLANALLGKNRGATETLLTQLIAQGSSPFMLLGLLTKTFSTLLRIRSLMDRGLSQNQIRADINLAPWIFSKYVPLAQRRTTSELSRDLEALLVADFRLKDRSLGPAAILSQIAGATAEGGSR